MPAWLENKKILLRFKVLLYSYWIFYSFSFDPKVVSHFQNLLISRVFSLLFHLLSNLCASVMEQLEKIWRRDLQDVHAESLLACASAVLYGSSNTSGSPWVCRVSKNKLNCIPHPCRPPPPRATAAAFEEKEETSKAESIVTSTTDCGFKTEQCGLCFNPIELS